MCNSCNRRCLVPIPGKRRASSSSSRLGLSAAGATAGETRRVVSGDKKTINHSDVQHNEQTGRCLATTKRNYYLPASQDKLPPPPSRLQSDAVADDAIKTAVDMHGVAQYSMKRRTVTMQTAGAREHASSAWYLGISWLATDLISLPILFLLLFLLGCHFVGPQSCIRRTLNELILQISWPLPS